MWRSPNKGGHVVTYSVLYLYPVVSVNKSTTRSLWRLLFIESLIFDPTFYSGQVKGQVVLPVMWSARRDVLWERIVTALYSLVLLISYTGSTPPGIQYTLALYRPNKYIDIGVHCGLKSNIGAHFQECHGIRSLYCCFLFIKLEYFHLIKSKIYEAINVTNHNIPFHLFFKKFIHWINVLTICNLIKTYFCSTDKERLTFFELLFVKINRMHNMDIAIGKCGLVRSKKPFF